MRELVSLLAFDEKPIDVEIPKGLVSSWQKMIADA